MSASSTIRAQIESALAQKFPSALTPPARMVRPVVSTGIGPLDELVHGGLPVGAMTELVGETCSGRMSLALSFLAQVTAAEKVCAWIDAANTFNPAAASAAGVDLRRLLWVRCGVTETVTEQQTRTFALPSECFKPKPVIKGLHGGGHGAHPRNEIKGLSTAVDRFLSDPAVRPHCAEPILNPRPESQKLEPTLEPGLRPSSTPNTTPVRTPRRARVYDAIEQALKATDLLLQTGGFSAIVLDFGEIPAEPVLRMDLSIWHRYRVAAEQMQASIVLLTPCACAKSGSELQLRLSALQDTREERTVFTGLSAHAEVLRHRFTPAPSHVAPIRKPPQRAPQARWTYRATWVGPKSAQSKSAESR
ncbi:MAG: recombinase RecA [Acidobacteriaceae bacterium]